MGGGGEQWGKREMYGGEAVKREKGGGERDGDVWVGMENRRDDNGEIPYLFLLNRYIITFLFIFFI